jgi:hypothetical protein
MPTASSGVREASRFLARSVRSSTTKIVRWDSAFHLS